MSTLSPLVDGAELAERRPPAAPPLWSLPLALLLVVAAFLAFFAERRAADAAWARTMAANVERIERGPGGLRVAVLGNSLLGRAIGEAGDVEAAARDRGLPIVWSAVFQPGRRWDFEAWLERMVAARPDLLLLPDNVLFHPPRASGSQERLSTLAGYMRTRVNDFLQRNDPQLLSKPQAFAIGGARLSPREVEIRRALNRSFFRPLGGLRLELLRRARTQGTQVVVLVMPLTAEELDTYAESGAVAKTLERLPVDEGISVWRCPLEFADGDFIDGRHLGDAASDRYVDWLIGMIDTWWRGHAG